MILSLPKLLGLFAVIWLVWAVFRLFEARQKNHADRRSCTGGGKPSRGAEVTENREDAGSVDLQECDLCGAWFSGKTCGRENCPD